MKIDDKVRELLESLNGRCGCETFYVTDDPIEVEQRKWATYNIRDDDAIIYYGASDSDEVEDSYLSPEAFEHWLYDDPDDGLQRLVKEMRELGYEGVSEMDIPPPAKRTPGVHMGGYIFRKKDSVFPTIQVEDTEVEIISDNSEILAYRFKYPSDTPAATTAVLVFYRSDHRDFPNEAHVHLSGPRITRVFKSLDEWEHDMGHIALDKRYVVADLEQDGKKYTEEWERADEESEHYAEVFYIVNELISLS